MQPIRMLALAMTVVLAGATVPAEAQTLRGTAYAAAGRCGPFPRIAVNTPKGVCVGLVAGRSDGLKMPRNVLPLSATRFLVSDLGSWVPGRGAVLELTLGSDGAPRTRTVFANLDRPHGLARGSDGKVYVGEVGIVWRFDPDKPPQRDVVLPGLPKDGLHSLKSLAFAPDGSLYVNHGSRTDRCEARVGQPPQVPCPELASAKPDGAVWRARFDTAGKVIDYGPIAVGLRNSIALAVHPRSGIVLQADNGLDLPDEDQPPEELNVLVAGANYGWPYCTGKSFRTPNVKGAKPCSAFRAPLLTMPAHSAPLGLLSYQGKALPDLRGHWLVSWHGYRSTGHRLVAYAADARGRPTGRPRMIIDDWGAKPGVRPLGAPVGLGEAPDGSVFIADDKNGAILVLRPE